MRQFADSPDPGEDFNCRCWAEHVPDPYTDAIYPSMSPLDLIGGGMLLKGAAGTATRIMTSPLRDTKWVLGQHKSAIRWGNQLKKRDWTPEQITQTIKRGKKYKAPNKVNPENTATRYEHNDRFVVQDDKTKEILQISDKNFIANKLP